MADLQRNSLDGRDVEQAITALKKGAYLLKYGRRGKPKFCPFRLSDDETLLIWYTDKEEKQLKLSQVSRVIPGQRTAIFRRYPRPEKEYQSFSLIYNARSLDLICKDKEEADVWFVGLRALISRGNDCQLRLEARSDTGSLDNPYTYPQRSSPSIVSSCSSDIIYKDPGDAQTNVVPSKNPTQKRLGKAFSDFMLHTAASKVYTRAESFNESLSSLSSEISDNPDCRSSTVDSTSRISLSSVVSSSSLGSFQEDFDAVGDVYIWGEGIGDRMLGGGVHSFGSSSATTMDTLWPKALESTTLLDSRNIACGSKHAVLVTKQGQIFSWGDGSGGRLGHGVDADVSHPKLVDALSGLNAELVACGEYHTCAVTLSGDLYTWGDGTHNFGLLGHGNEISHWTPKKVSGMMEGMHVSCISCGPWHTAAVTSSGQLFTFGDGAFGVLGHGDRSSTSMPREVEALRGQRTVRASCGVWHTAAVVEVAAELFISGSSSTGKLFTWGDGEKWQLGHGDKEPRLVPSCVVVLDSSSFCQVACGHSITIALTASGQVYTMGSADYGQLGCPGVGKFPTCVEGKIRNSFIEQIACGSHHVAVLSSKAEVFTWGKGANGQLGHGDYDDRNIPTLVEALMNKKAKRVVCGSNFTAAICLHRSVCTDHSICSGCHNPFGFRRKRHNCYNCGLVFCNACSCRKSVKASLAPNKEKPYRVCDDCFVKLMKALEPGSTSLIPKVPGGSIRHNFNEVAEKETQDPRSLGRVSRLASFKRSDSQQSKNDKSLENDVRVSPISNGSFEGGSFHRSKSSTSIFGYSCKLPGSIPNSRMVSRASSPISTKSTPADLAYSDVIADYSKQTKQSLAQEIIKLRTQVEGLNHKSQYLEAELEKTSMHLKETAKIAKEEAEKNKSSKEVIRSLTAQIHDLKIHRDTERRKTHTMETRENKSREIFFSKKQAENWRPWGRIKDKIIKKEL